MIQIPYTAEIWSFQRRLTHRLLAWGLPNVLLGGLLATTTHRPGLRAFSRQSAVWGMVNTAIAYFGQRHAERLQVSAVPAREAKQARGLRRLLFLNAGLDVLYMAIGFLLARGTVSASRRGHGAAVVIQGSFLLLFDLLHAGQVPRPVQSQSVTLTPVSTASEGV